MTLSVLSYFPQALGSLSVRYLIIASGFPYVKIQHYSENYTSPIIYKGSKSHSFTKTFGYNLSLDGDDVIRIWLNGYSIHSQWNYTSLDIDLTIVSWNSTTVKFVLKNKYSQSCYLYRLGFDLVIYHKKALTDHYAGVTFYSSTDTQFNNSRSYTLDPNTISSSSCFFGVSRLKGDNIYPN